jgi:hypothetical protein
LPALVVTLTPPAPAVVAPLLLPALLLAVVESNTHAWSGPAQT